MFAFCLVSKTDRKEECGEAATGDTTATQRSTKAAQCWVNFMIDDVYI